LGTPTEANKLKSLAKIFPLTSKHRQDATCRKERIKTERREGHVPVIVKEWNIMSNDDINMLASLNLFL
jgi:hypothetical protein